LSTALSAMRLAQQSTMASIWEVGLLPHPHSQPLLLFPIHWEFSSFSHSILRGRFSIPLSPPLSVLDYDSLLMLSSFLGSGGFNLSKGCTRLCFSGGEGVLVAHVVHLLGLQIYTGSVEYGQRGEKVCQFS
jgi:hypothetical protein